MSSGDNDLSGTYAEPSSVGSKMDNMAFHIVGRHYAIATAVICVLSIVVVVLLFKSMKESFNPTATQRAVGRDDYGTEGMSDKASGVATVQSEAQQATSAPGCNSAPSRQEDVKKWQLAGTENATGVRDKSLAQDEIFNQVMQGH